MSANLSGLLTLSMPERIQLVEDLWDSIAAEAEGLSLTDWQKEELARREEKYSQNPGLASTWEEARQRILARHDH